MELNEIQLSREELLNAVFKPRNYVKEFDTAEHTYHLSNLMVLSARLKSRLQEYKWINDPDIPDVSKRAIIGSVPTREEWNKELEYLLEEFDKAMLFFTNVHGAATIERKKNSVLIAEREGMIEKISELETKLKQHEFAS